MTVDENVFRTVIETLQVGVLIQLANTEIVLCNPKALELLGLTKDQLLGKTSLDAGWNVIHDDGTPFPGDTHPVPQAIATRKLVRDVVMGVFRPTKNDRVWLLVNAEPQIDLDGIVRQVVCTFTDITVNRQIERERNRIEERIRLALKASRVGLWDWNLQTNSVVYSRESKDLIGYDDNEIEHVYQNWESRVHPNDLGRVLECMQSHLAGTDAEYDVEFRIRHKNGSWRWIRARGEAIRDTNGIPVEMLGCHFDITDQKLTEIALKESEDRLQLALKAESAIAFVWDAKSDQVIRYFSTEPTHPANPDHPESVADVRSRIHPDDLAIFDAGVNSCLENGSEYRNLFRVIRPDSSVAWLEEWGHLERYDDGSPRRLTGFAINVTKRMEAEHSLRLTQFSIDRAVDSIFWISPAGEILFVNDAAANALGYAREELIGKSVQQIDPNFSAESWSAHWEEIKARRSYTFVSNQITRDGRKLITEVSVNYLLHEGQEYNCAFVRDITERRRTEEDLNRLWENAIDPLCIIGIDGYLKKINPAWVNSLGWTEQELLGHPLMDYAHPEDRVATISAGRKLCDGESVAGFENRYRCKDGSYRWFSWNAIPQLSTGLAYGFIRDITERKRLECQFQHSQKMEAIGRLAGGVAHDFNNLITIINGYGSLILEEFPSGSAQRDSVLGILDAGDRAAHLTQQLLTFSRKAIVQPRILDLNEIVDKTANLLRRLIEEDIVLTVVHDPASPRVLAASWQLEQILMNLVVNARDAMPDGGVLRIEIRSVTLGNDDLASYPDLKPGLYAELKVADTGHGIADEVKDKIFEPFFTTKEVGKGTGLGLSVVHGAVKQCGGAIAVESQLNVGTTFEILLPVVVEEVVDTKVGIVQESLQGAATILLVEDEIAVRRFVRIILEKSGYKVLEASGGTQAIQIAAEFSERIDLLLSDVVMPEMGGPKLAQTMRQMRPGIRVLFISGHTEDAVLQRGVAESSEILLQKPFTSSNLVSKVRAVLSDGK